MYIKIFMTPRIDSDKSAVCSFCFFVFSGVAISASKLHPPKMGGCNFVIHFLVFYTLFCTFLHKNRVARFLRYPVNEKKMIFSHKQNFLKLA